MRLTRDDLRDLNRWYQIVFVDREAYERALRHHTNYVYEKYALR